MKKLHEFITDGDHPIAKEVFSVEDLGSYQGTLEKYIHLVITEAASPKVVFGSLIERFDGKSPSFDFNQLVRVKRKLTFADCLILCTCYTWHSKPRIKGMILRELPSENAAVWNILSVTKGYLLLPHQFENIAMLTFSITLAQARELRQSFNKKKPDLYQGLDGSRVKTFKAILRTHSVSDAVMSPSYYHAKNLHDFLNG